MKTTIMVLLGLMSVLLIVGCTSKEVKEAPTAEVQEVTPLDQDLDQINPELIDGAANIDSSLNDATDDLGNIG